MTEELQDPLKSLAEITAPDVRQSFFIGSLADIHSELSETTLHEQVPLNVRQLFETAKNVSLYSWFVYPFHQVSEMVAYAALELALSTKAGFVEFSGPDAPRAPTLAPLLLQAQKEGWIKSSNYPSLHERAVGRARFVRLIPIIAEMKDEEVIPLPEPTEAEIEAAKYEIDLVQILVENAPKLRNKLAHGSSTLSPRSRQTLILVAETINQLF